MLPIAIAVYWLLSDQRLRQIYLAARNYATEYKDSLPFGMAFNKMQANGRPAGSSSD